MMINVTIYIVLLLKEIRNVMQKSVNEVLAFVFRYKYGLPELSPTMLSNTVFDESTVTLFGLSSLLH